MRIKNFLKNIQIGIIKELINGLLSADFCLEKKDKIKIKRK